MYNSAEISLRIKVLALQKKITIGNMLAECDLNINTLSQLNRGQAITSERLYKIADYLDVSVDFLLGRTEVKEVNRK